MQIATRVVASLLAMETLDETADIKLYINSQGVSASHIVAAVEECTVAVLATNFAAAAGGQAYSIMAILDAMDAVKPDISTIAIGLCASTATLLLVRSAGHAVELVICLKVSANSVHTRAGSWNERQALQHAKHAHHDAPALRCASYLQ